MQQHNEIPDHEIDSYHFSINKNKTLWDYFILCKRRLMGNMIIGSNLYVFLYLLIVFPNNFITAIKFFY